MYRGLRGRLAAGLVVSLALGACQSGSTSVQSSPGEASSTAEAASTATLMPLALPRPSDIPTDGTCNEGHICLGLLAARKTYNTRAFKPTITFQAPSSGWENLADEAQVFQLLPLDMPGDAIAFFRGARAVNGDGSFAPVDQTVAALSGWLASNKLLEVTPAKRVTVGGLPGVTMDIKIAAGAANHPSDCEVQICVPIFKGQDLAAHPPWHWDWGSAGPEAQRLYLLTAKDGVVAIFVDSLDGTTFRTLTANADRILATAKFT
jgi:hypothetical protein